MKLTKLQRHTLYCILQHMFETKEHFFFCDAVKDLVDIDLDKDWVFSSFKLMMPELWEKRNAECNEHSGFLFYSHNSRLSALNECIIETA